MNNPNDMFQLCIHPQDESDLKWTFFPFESSALEQVFLPLMDGDGVDLVSQLDDVLLDTPQQAGVRATKVYKQVIGSSAENAEKVRQFMSAVANNLSAHPVALDPILPQSTLWRDRG